MTSGDPDVTNVILDNFCFLSISATASDSILYPLPENKLLLITAVKVMDEYYETKKKVEQKKIELKELSNKFKELKNLVYDYKDKKEEEIRILNKKHDNLKFEIENNQKNYEKIIDQTANEISSFIEKANSKKLS